MLGPMNDVVRLLDAETSVEVHAEDGPHAVRVNFGPGPDGVTFVGTLSDLHRIFVEVDNQVSRLVTRPSRVST